MRQFLLILILLGKFHSVIAQLPAGKDRPWLTFQPGSNTLNFKFAISADGSLMLVSNSSHVLLIDVRKGAVVHEFNENYSIDQLQFSPKGDSILVVLNSMVVSVQSPRRFYQLNILNTHTLSRIDSLRSDHIKLSPDSKYLLSESVTPDGSVVATLRLIYKWQPLLQYTEKDNILNDGDIVGNRVVYKYTPPQFEFPDFRKRAVQVSGNRALLSVRGITRLWDLKQQKHISRLDTADLEKSDPSSFTKFWIGPLSARYGSDHYLLTDDRKTVRVNSDFIYTYDHSGKLIHTDSLEFYFRPSLDGDGSELVRERDPFRVKDVRSLGDDKFISRINDETYLGTQGNLEQLMVDDPSNRLDGSDIRLFNDFLISADREGLKFWDLTTGKQVLDIFFAFKYTSNTKNYSWATVHHEYGYFDVDNLENAKQVTWSFPGELSAYPLEVFMRDFYMPQLLYKTLQREPLNKSSRDFSKINKTLPEPGLTNFKQLNDTLCSIDIDLNESVDTYSVHLFRNGKLVKVIPERAHNVDDNISAWRAESLVTRNDPRLKNIRIALPQQNESKTTLSVYAFNNDRVKSTLREKTFPIKQKSARKGRLVILTIAVSHCKDQDKNLNHTILECERFAAGIKKRIDKTEFSGIKQINLLSQAASGFQPLIATAAKTEIESTFKWLSTGGIKPEDHLIIFHSGHGLIDAEGKFYLIPYDFDKQAPYTSSISSAQLAQWIEGVDAGSIFLFIDACYSGAIENQEYISGPFGDPGFGQLSYNKVIPVLTSARKLEKAETMGIGLITERLENKVFSNTSSLFDLMMNISVGTPAGAQQQPQFMFWGKTPPASIKLK